MSIGISKKDPWGTEYGYCVWDYGSIILNPACQGTPGVDRRLEGGLDQGYPVVALVSAGPDKTFSTTCRNFSTGPGRADQNNNGSLADAGDLELVGKTADADDIIYTYTYQEAMAASGGLWTLKSGDATKATIDKDLEVTGGARFSGTGMFDRLAATGSDYLEVISGLKLGSATLVNQCDLANNSVLRLAADNKSLEMCDGTATPPAWKTVGGAESTTTTMMTVAATGSFTKTEVGDFDIYQFTGSGSLNVTALGNDPTDGSKIEYLLVGGGGGNGGIGGGGAGGVIGNTMSAVVQTYPVVVGAAGSGSTALSNMGGDSSFAGLVAKGGGAGGATHAWNGQVGGSGGGGSGSNAPGPTPALGIPGQGYGGCPGYAVGGIYAGGGGGGAGGPCPNTYQPGPGMSSSITGSTVTYACGGGGHQFSDGASGTAPPGCVGGANRGHGGSWSGNPYAASAGVVILKIKQRGGTATSSIAYPLNAPDGSAAAPSFSFTSQPTKGIYVDSGNLKISGLSAPTANDHAANKQYVDAAVAAASGGGTKRIIVKRHNTNSFPSCPITYAALGCFRSGDNPGKSPGDDVGSGIFDNSVDLNPFDKGIIWNGAAILTHAYPPYTYSGGWYYEDQQLMWNGIQMDRWQASAYDANTGNSYPATYGVCLCSPN